jgi:hypothetical protein
VLEVIKYDLSYSKKNKMRKISPFLLIMITVGFMSCEKEYSIENGGTASDQIVGVDCRISKIIYTDTAGVDTNTGVLEATINSSDIVTKIVKFDSLSNIIEFIGTPTYTNDTVYITPDEYFVVDANKRISKMHGLVDPTDPFSLQFDVFYQYNGGGYLIAKNYFLTGSPTTPFYKVEYTYALANLVRMTGTDVATGDLVIDADMTYYNTIVPRRYIYIFPDEKAYPYYTQFFDFGAKSYNAVKEIKVRNYDPGNTVRDSIVSSFSNYVMSRDTYILSVQMAGDDQPSIPAQQGKLSFKYKCK